MHLEVTPTQLGLLSAALHFVSHSPALDQDSKEAHLTREYIHSFRDELYQLMDVAAESDELPTRTSELTESEQAVYWLAHQFAECLFCAMVFDSFDTVQQLTLRHSQWGMENLVKRLTDPEGGDLRDIMRADDPEDFPLPDLDD